MVNFTSYDSDEEMADALSAANSEASLRVDDWQAAITAGCFYYAVDYEEQLVIYGMVLDPVAGERAAGASEREVQYVEEMYKAPGMESYRAARSYSVYCPEGEMGDIHVSTVSGVLTQGQFEAAREQGWPSSPGGIQAILKLA